MSRGFGGNHLFDCHIRKFIGETVTVFTTSGGESGSGFTGTMLAANCDFIRLVVRQGSAPTYPFEDKYGRHRRHKDHCCYRAGAVIDIPIDRIAGFVHNAI